MKIVTTLLCLLFLVGTASYGGQTGSVSQEGSQVRQREKEISMQEGRRGPPPEAYKACEGRGAGSEAQFTNPRGEIVKGSCEKENGKMVLRPYANRGEGREQANPAPGQGR